MRHQRTTNTPPMMRRIDEQGIHMAVAREHETDRAIVRIDRQPQIGPRQEILHQPVDLGAILGRQEMMRGVDRRAPDRDHARAILGPGIGGSRSPVTVEPDPIDYAARRIARLQAQYLALPILVAIESPSGRHASRRQAHFVDAVDADRRRAGPVGCEGQHRIAAAENQELVRAGLQEHRADPAGRIELAVRAGRANHVRHIIADPHARPALRLAFHDHRAGSAFGLLLQDQGRQPGEFAIDVADRGIEALAAPAITVLVARTAAAVDAERREADRLQGAEGIERIGRAAAAALGLGDEQRIVGAA